MNGWKMNTTSLLRKEIWYTYIPFVNPESGREERGSWASCRNSLSESHVSATPPWNESTLSLPQDGRQGVWGIPAVFRAASPTHQGPIQLLYVSTEAKVSCYRIIDQSVLCNVCGWEGKSEVCVCVLCHCPTLACTGTNFNLSLEQWYIRVNN